MMAPAREQLAFFPLNVVVFPNEKLELYVFEPCYCELIHQCDENEHSFGIIPVLKDELLSYGTEVELLKVNRSKTSGTSRIEVRGKRIFNVLSFKEKLDDHLYGGGEVVFRVDSTQPQHLPTQDDILTRHSRLLTEPSTPAKDVLDIEESSLQKQANVMFVKIRELLKQKGGFVFSKQSQGEEMSNTDFLGSSYTIAPHIIGLDLKGKAVLLSMEQENERLRFICEHMKNLLTVLEKSLND